MEQHKLVLELAPYLLSVSPLDCEALDLLFGFDSPTAATTTSWSPTALGRSVRPWTGWWNSRVDGDHDEPSMTLAWMKSAA